MSGDGERVGAEIEDATQPRDDAGQRGQPGEADRGVERVPVAGPNGHPPLPAVQLDGPRVAAIAHALDARDGAEPQKLSHARPIVGGLESQEQADLATRTGRSLHALPAAQCARRTTVQRHERLVEPATTPDAP